MFTPEDLKQLKEIGFSIQIVKNQVKHFTTGFPSVNLIRPAVINDGIKLITTNGEIKLNSDFDDYAKTTKIVKFVPASGAATRMFKDLFDFKENFDKLGTNPKVLEFGSTFFQSINRFAFYQDLDMVMDRDGLSLKEELNSRNYRLVLDYLLLEKGLNYANLPKALIKFHRSENATRTALEEHLVESALYGKSGDGVAYIHFTISPEHVPLFEALISEVVPAYEKKYQVKFNITHSIQLPTTDTIAVNPDNTPFRTNDGKLLFRPAGHGALIWNVNQLDGDIIFIKNIDNVVPERKGETTIVYKKIIGSLLIQFKHNIDKILKKLTSQSKIKIEDVISFVKNELFIELPEGFENFSEADQKQKLISILNRPIRVCGMVKNEGEPGGGPFWVKSNDGNSLQIVESSQIDFGISAQKRIVDQSTHFNPVDIVCSIRDYKGETFDLSKFVDTNTGFISVKSKDGKALKALELPGLWNGAMSKWITIFVEVPIATFNPVKTVNDLLRSEHQN